MTVSFVAGTFNRFHNGHKALLNKAFDVGDEVIIGVMSDEYASQRKSVKVASIDQRRAFVEKFVRDKGKKYRIITIDEHFDPDSVGFDILVASHETAENALMVQASEQSFGHKIDLLIIPLEYASDGNKISSTGIVKGLYDEEGKEVKQ